MNNPGHDITYCIKTPKGGRGERRDTGVKEETQGRKKRHRGERSDTGASSLQHQQSDLILPLFESLAQTPTYLRYTPFCAKPKKKRRCVGEIHHSEKNKQSSAGFFCIPFHQQAQHCGRNRPFSSLKRLLIVSTCPSAPSICPIQELLSSQIGSSGMREVSSLK